MATWRPQWTLQTCQVVVVLLLWVQPDNALRCYECSDSFTDIWMPQDCQVNVTAVPYRLCNDIQPFCYVASMTVKGILTQITRDCVDQCFYGCVASDFGVTSITCTSCCDHDFCNTGNAVARVSASGLIVSILTLLSAAAKVMLSNFVD